MEAKKTIYQLHDDHKVWLNKLAFYKDEIFIMQHRISEIAIKNTSKEVLSFVEHFQNQLIIQRDQLDRLKLDIKKHELFIDEIFIEDELINNGVPAEHKALSDHIIERNKIENFEKIFNDLRNELINFLSKWM